MSVKDILAVAAILIMASFAVGITYSWCVELYFARKEEHLKWLAKGGKRE